MSSLHNNVNICTNVFCEYLATVIDLHCPLKTKTIRHNNVPYMNADLRKLQYQRNMMRNLKNANPNPENFERYRILRNKCVKLRLSSQRKYFEQRCDGGPKNQHFWSTIKPFITSKCKSNKDIILCESDATRIDKNPFVRESIGETHGIDGFPSHITINAQHLVFSLMSAWTSCRINNWMVGGLSHIDYIANRI